MKDKEGNHGVAKQAAHTEPSTGQGEEPANLPGANEVETPARPTVALGPQSGKEDLVGDLDSNSNARPRAAEDAHQIQAAQTDFPTGQEQQGPQATSSGQQEVYQEQHGYAADNVEYGHGEDEYGYDNSEKQQGEEYGYSENQPKDDANKVGYDEDAEKQDDAKITGHGNDESGMSIQMVSYLVICTSYYCPMHV